MDGLRESTDDCSTPPNKRAGSLNHFEFSSFSSTLSFKALTPCESDQSNAKTDSDVETGQNIHSLKKKVGYQLSQFPSLCAI
ncbi:hypothetical protein AVEN_51403-1 [Araneus ventricosus]|uniref:Uncharacterized protein n=1 Tax=Araneus ventricosus TaxID=182803 RepID=A0A4Y2PNX6_ARAVE|nr:hypothetical protein AVEN_51403-1 [Araneus ventricosus]